MSTKKEFFSHRVIQLVFLFSVLGVVLVINGIVFWPFVLGLFMAGVFGIALLPLYTYLLRHVRGKTWIASGITLCVFLFMILVPIILISGIFFQEMRTFYVNATQAGGLMTHIESIQDSITQPLSELFPNVDFNIHIAQAIQQSLENIVQQTGKIFSGVANGGLHVIIFSLALFYILSYAESIKQFILTTIPMEQKHSLRIIHQVRDSIYGVIQEILFLFIMRLIVIVLLFSLFGIPNPFFWSMIGALLGIIPGIGMILAIIPASLYFLLSGSTGLGIGLLIAGLFSVILIENILGPKFIEKNLKVHPFLILLSMIGGLLVFGGVGFFIGPIFLGLLGVLIEEFPKLYKESH
jgi:predicted PurR-regulated permease PerM